MERTSAAGKVWIVRVIVSRTCSALRPSGRCNNITNRVEQRSTSVPIAAVVVFAHDQVAFPVAGHGTVSDFRGPIRDHDLVRDLTSSFEAPSRPPFGPPGTQAPGELVAELTPALHEQRLVDRLVRDRHARIVAEIEAEPPDDLLRREQPLEIGLHPLTQRGVDRQLRRLRSTSPPPRLFRGHHRPIGDPAAVGVHLTTDRRTMPAQPRSDLPRTTSRVPGRS